MAQPCFTVDDLIVILREGAGETDDVDLDGNVLDVSFEDLGYDSLALLETGIRIEGTYGVSLDDDALAGTQTPREVVRFVNALLAGEKVHSA